MALTQEYQDCDSIISLRSSCGVEVNNLYTSISAIIASMVIITADVPRRAKFDTMYGKIDASYVKEDFDAYVISLQALKTYLEDEGFIPE